MCVFISLSLDGILMYKFGDIAMVAIVFHNAYLEGWGETLVPG